VRVWSVLAFPVYCAGIDRFYKLFAEALCFQAMTLYYRLYSPAPGPGN